MQQFVICVGAQKAGTSWLFKCLEEHPSIYTAKGKETNFFMNKNVSLEEYLSFFSASEKKDTNIYFEASPLYLCDTNAPEEIRFLLPESKIIILLRDPVERSISHYNHLRYKGYIAKDVSLKDALTLRPDIIKHSEYTSALEKYKKQFPPGNILVLDFRRLATEPQKVLDEVSVFLNISIFTPKVIKSKYNSGAARSNIFYNYLTSVYLKLNRNRLGKKLVKVIKTLGFNNSLLEKILSKTNTKKSVVDDSEIDLLEKLLKEEIYFYNNLFDTHSSFLATTISDS